ncbi:hypothetical protein BDQ12DRAFT_338930 [Crucibulum laeve]|uniref:F-box domain-containing protein n=1 Tax=Crucibulum laeve TaxID=68775 RepID=A0A5C3LPH5_9AGAR|nr:hypothetical protein BDQ12DRAFT_338930 [Crucibulum laeve]
MIPLFLGPHLRKIAFYIDRTAVNLCLSILSSLGKSYPGLESIELEYVPGEYSDRFLKVTSLVAMEWSHLQHFKATNVSYNALAHLASLPNLQSLQFYDLGTIPRHQNKTIGHGFPALKRLHVSTLNPEHCLGLIESLSSGPLERLSLSFDEPTPSVVWKELCNALKQYCNPKYLKAIELEDYQEEYMGYNGGLDADDYIIGLEHFTSLFSFHNLTDLILKPFYGFHFSSEAIHNIAMKWPNMEHLTLRPNAVHPLHASGITLHDLETFAKHCRKLEHLGLIFDTTLPNNDNPSKRTEQQSLDTLKVLHVGHSPLGDQPSVAAYLSGIFPSLDHIETFEGTEGSDDGEGTSVDRAWLNVSRLVPVFARVRAEERALANAQA